MTQQQRDALDAAMRESPLDTTVSPQEHRRDFALRFTPPLPDGVDARELTVGGVPALRLDVAGASTTTGTVLYLHGGGYMIGSARSRAPMASELARNAGATVVSIDYRLAPEHPFPAAVEDALAAYRGLLDSGTPADSVVVAGDSAGGGLAVVLLLAARDAGLPLPAGAVVFSPWTDLTLSGRSVDTKAGRDPLFDRSALTWYADHYLAGADPADPRVSPVLADLSGLPPLFVQVGSHEVLVDDAVRLAGAAAEADVEVRLEVVAQVPHVFHTVFGALDEADAALARAGAFVRERLTADALVP